MEFEKIVAFMLAQVRVVSTNTKNLLTPHLELSDGITNSADVRNYDSNKFSIPQKKQTQFKRKVPCVTAQF